jgi:hypothetical protein
VAAVASAAAAGCGGSSKKVTTTQSGRAAPVAPGPSPRTATSTATRTASVPPTTTTGASNVRLPATFTIRPGGALTPPTVGAPTGVAVHLTLISGDHAAHRAAVAGHTLSVAAGGRASVLLSGLRKGNYPLTVDGVRRGTLVIGVQPGP